MDTRDDLITTALSLFAARGYEAVGVQEIVEAAGVTKPTLYHWFGSKRGLLDAVLAAEFDELLDALGPATEDRRDVMRSLDGLVSLYFDFARRRPTACRMGLAMWFAPPESEAFAAIAHLNARQQEALEAFFERAVEQHGNMRGRQRAYAATLLGMINTYVGLALNGRVTLDDSLRRQAVHQFMHGIFS